MVLYWLGLYIIFDYIYPFLYEHGAAFIMSNINTSDPLSLALFSLVGILLLITMFYPILLWGFTAFIGTWSLVMLSFVFITKKLNPNKFKVVD